MSKLKKNRCVCKVCHVPFRSKVKFKDVCPDCNQKQVKTEAKVERCGFCGRYFIGVNYLDEYDLEDVAMKSLVENAPLGYCPNAQQEDYEQNPENYN